MTDAELLKRWAVDREISGSGHALAMAFERHVKDLEEQLAIAIEQFKVACSRAEAWKDMCDKFKELAEARGVALDLREPRGPCGRRWHAADCVCNGEGGDR